MNHRQQAIIDFIRDFPYGYPPTIREIAAGVGLSSSATVHNHLNILAKHGYLERRPNSPRCIVLTNEAK